MGADSVYGELLRVLAALAVVVPAAYLSTRLLSGRHWARRGRYMKLVESLPLGSQKGLHLVEVGEHLYLLGGSERGISLLAEVERGSVLRPVPAGASEEAEGEPGAAGASCASGASRGAAPFGRGWSAVLGGAPDPRAGAQDR